MPKNKKKVAIIGTNGIPSKYGGFETLVEYLANYLSSDFDITVYCSSKFQDSDLVLYKGVNLCYVNFNANGWQSIFFDFFSLIRCYKNFDKILILGCSGGLFFPMFCSYKHKFIINIGGLDWKRSKWNFIIQKFLKLSERYAVTGSDFVISDNQGIKEYLLDEYEVDSCVIPYGGDQVFTVNPSQFQIDKYQFIKNLYAFTVARIQPDNNIEMLFKSFNENSLFPLVIVGNWDSSKYGQKLKKEYLNKPNIIILDAIYDQSELNLVRSNCFVYLHGHSAGGTNPALVEAMNLGLPILAYDNVFNRYTTFNQAQYFLSSEDLNNLLKSISMDDLKLNADKMKAISRTEYTWKKVCKDYADIFSL